MKKIWLSILVIAIAVPAVAQRDPLFKTEILPVLEKNCVECHGPQQKMAKLDLSSFTGMMEGSSSGPVIAPGKPERSLMWKLIENDQMPQGGKLTVAEKQLIKSYIQYGRFPQATAETEAAMRAREAAKITAAGSQLVVVPQAGEVRRAGRGEQGPGAHADRRLRPGAARADGLEDAARGRPSHAHPARLFRPDRPAADSRRSQGLRRRQVAERLGEGDRPPAGLAALWRAVGPALAGRGGLLRFARRRRRQRSRSLLEIPRLRDPRVQQEQADQPVHPGATGRRSVGQLQAPGHPDAGPDRAADRHRLHADHRRHHRQPDHLRSGQVFRRPAEGDGDEPDRRCWA